MEVEIVDLGSLNEQKLVLVRISNKLNHTIEIMNYGGIVHSWKCPDKEGVISDILLGCTNLNMYIEGHPYFGAIIGRYANRISFGKFSINEHNYTLAQNLKNHHLHGGISGFDKKIWDYAVTLADEKVILELNYTSVDMEEGYPGSLKTTVSYTFDENGTLTIQYHAISDRDTIINLTNHCYFNLSGNTDNTVLDHEVMIASDFITEVDEDLIPTGKLISVEGTPFDFRQFYPVGLRISDPAFFVASGYDHNYVLRDTTDGVVAEARHLISGRRLSVFTSEPGLQLYTGNFLEGVSGKNGLYKKYCGFCLETQHFPDSPNRPEFPTTLLKAGELYFSETKYRLTLF